MNKGFTLIELVISIVIICILSAIILFSVSQYINRGKDANLKGNMVVLITGGENYYSGNNSYNGFCDVDKNSLIKNIVSQISPQNPDSSNRCWAESTPNRGNISGNPQSVCCAVLFPTGQAWAACAKEFANPKYAFCVDSRGVRKDICSSSCTTSTTVCPSSCSFGCPDTWPNCL